MALPISSSYRVFWTGKYLERAEVVARLLDQKLLHASDRADGSPREVFEWESMLKSFGVYSEFVRRHGGDVSSKEVIAFFVFEEHCPSSILHCIHMARENASGSMPDDLFVTLNKLHLKLHEPLSPDLLARDPHAFLGEVIETCMQVVGIVNRLWG